jgi:hypothetical protein
MESWHHSYGLAAKGLFPAMWYANNKKAAHPGEMAAGEHHQGYFRGGGAALSAIRPTPSCQLISPKRQSDF